MDFLTTICVSALQSGNLMSGCKPDKIAQTHNNLGTSCIEVRWIFHGENLISC